MTATLLEQFPRFSEYDPGSAGEGSLDPLGLAAVADRIADRLAPGVRARMSQPRFVTLSAVGAYACQPISDIVSTDGKSTFDLAFEWLVVESLVHHPNPNRLRGVPGSQKAQRAVTTNERLSATTYLAGPRVFGFTGSTAPSPETRRFSESTACPLRTPKYSSTHGNVTRGSTASSRESLDRRVCGSAGKSRRKAWLRSSRHASPRPRPGG